jgi:hypothetical protein
MNHSASTATVLEDDMCIDMCNLRSKLCSLEISPYTNILSGIIEQFTNALSSPNPQDKILSIYGNCKDLHSSTSVHEVLDSLRQAFTLYADGGLHLLYTRQENEVWFPKIVLTSELTPNDINSLGDSIIIYRGCDQSELLNNEYGQAWSTSLQAAKLFAYTHYTAQPWFISSNRVLLAASIERDGIYFSDQKVEYEVVVDTSKLKNIKLV